VAVCAPEIITQLVSLLVFTVNTSAVPWRAKATFHCADVTLIAPADDATIKVGVTSAATTATAVAIDEARARARRRTSRRRPSRSMGAAPSSACGAAGFAARSPDPWATNLRSRFFAFAPHYVCTVVRGRVRTATASVNA
jgi:hypothetical protein